jgi:hypothetical protein
MALIIIYYLLNLALSLIALYRTKTIYIYKGLNFLHSLFFSP